MARRFASIASSEAASWQQWLVTPRQVASIATGTRRLAWIDATWFMPGSPRNAKREFQTGPRIPGARFFDVDSIATKPYRVPARNDLSADGYVSLPHMLPDIKTFAAAVSRLGIDEDTHVIAYDSAGCFSSPRLAWTFAAMGRRVSVLNGGLGRWISEGHPVEEGPVPEASGLRGKPLPLTVQDDMVVPFEDIMANLKRGEDDRALVLDARSAERWCGTAPEPRPGLSSGHIPHSLSLPFTALLSPPSATSPLFSTMLPLEELDLVFENALGRVNWLRVKSGEQVVWTSCGSGMTAAIIWLALTVLKVPKVGLYDESWTGWAARPDSIIAKSGA